ncbi:MAG: serine/threonine-protein kinase, partial [Acidobacteriota bacterium]
MPSETNRESASDASDPASSVDRDQRVRDLLVEVLETDARERRRVLDSLESDPSVIADVLGLLESDDEGFMAKPLVQQAGRFEIAADTLPKVPGFTVTGLLGEGGMGRVYLGHQESADERPVAIKMLRTSLPVVEMTRRFELERQALSRLNHPAIAQLYGAGRAEDGRHYVAMEFVDGPSIVRYCDRERLGIRARLELFVAICRGVEHAHRRQLLHRDLKPSNLLVATQDGEPEPKIIDFGIARTLEVDDGLTAFTGTGILGTPAYMSPEAVGPSDGPRDL